MPPAATGSPRRAGLLDTIERIGNALPNPISLFVIFAATVLVASAVVSALGVSVVHPKDGSTITAVNLLDRDGIRRIFTDAVKNFVGFAPLGTVLVAMLGIGVAEASGLIAAAMRALVMAMPRQLLTAVVVFTGVNANLAADAGIIVLPPIAAMLFAAAGRHPLAGIAAAFAGVVGGFSANLLPSTLDVLLIGLTQEALDASKLLTGYHAQVLGNWYFMAAATPLLTVVGTLVTHHIVEPRLGAWKSKTSGTLEPLSGGERRGLLVAGITLVVTLAGMLLLVMPGAPLRLETGTLLEQLKPFFDSMVMMVLLLFLLPGLAYGIAVGGIKNDQDIARMTGDTIATMGTYIVLAFACAQFVSYFAWSNLGAIIAISGANALQALGLQGGLLLTAFVGFSALINLFMTSSSALWAIMGPVFVPMFVLLGFTPEATQAVFRIGESATNIVTPLMPYMPFILTYANRYDPKVGSGSIVSMMLPYALAFILSWTLLLLAFYTFHWPIGPGVPIRLPG